MPTSKQLTNFSVCEDLKRDGKSISLSNQIQDMLSMKGCLIVITALLLARPSFCLSLNNHGGAYIESCVRSSTNREVEDPTCANMEKIGSQCYPPCPNGYSRSGTDCLQNCPNEQGWEDQGLYCRKVEYGRGVGYGWRAEDGLSNSGMFSRCEKDNGVGKCEETGLIVYPKCKKGYSNLGCCICRPKVPKCLDLGYQNGVDLSCKKKKLCWQN